MRRCCMCRIEKPEAEFAFRSLATGKRQDHCRQCHAAYRRQHYLDNRALYIAREVARMKGYRLENRIRISEYLETHPCVDCGECDPVLLEFDHRDRGQKRSEVARLATTKPWKIVVAEITKCDVRCGNCHRRRTSRQFGWAERVRGPQGVERFPVGIAAIDADARRRSPTDPAGSTRQCTRCLEERSITEFSVRNWKTGTRVRRCHSCIAAASRAHYWKDPQAYVARARKNRQKSRLRNRIEKAKLLASQRCIDCGETDPVVLEFDHRDRALKVANISRLAASNGWSSVVAEIAKCEVRCVNCHRSRTAGQFGWMKSALQPPPTTIGNVRV